MNLSRGSRRAVKMSDERVVPILAVGAQCAHASRNSRAKMGAFCFADWYIIE